MSLWMNFPLKGDLIDKNYSSLYRISYRQWVSGYDNIFNPGLLGNALYVKGTTIFSLDRYELLWTDYFGWTYYQFDFPDEFSWSMWVKPESMNSSGMRLWTLCYSSSGSDGNFPVWITSTGQVRASAVGAPNSSTKTFRYCTTDTDDVVASQWTHIAFVYKQNIIALYVNGEKKAIVDCPESLFTSDKTYMWFGQGVSPATSIGSFTGWISNFCFSTSGWSDADVKRMSVPILARYPMRYGEYYKQNPTSSYNKIIWPKMTDCNISGQKHHSWNRYASTYAPTLNFSTWLSSTFTGRHLKIFQGAPSGSSPGIFTNMDHAGRSISFWCNTENWSYPDGVIFTLPSLNSDSGSNRFVQLGVSSGDIALGWWTGEAGSLRKDVFDMSPSTIETFDPQASPSVQTLRLVTFTFDGSYMKIYIDGKLKGSLYNPYSDFSGIYFSNYTGTTNYTGFFGSSYFGGSISDIQIFAKVLSQEEIIEIFNQGVKFCASGQCRAAEFIETANKEEINIYPKGVVYCSDIQEDPTIETPQLLPNGVLKVKEIIEE